jgi:hypothetical protein
MVISAKSELPPSPPLGLVSVAIVERIVFVPIAVTGGQRRKGQQLFYNVAA